MENKTYLSVNETLEGIQVVNMINLSYDMTYFGKQEEKLKAADKLNCKYF